MRTHAYAGPVYEVIAHAASGFEARVSTSEASPATVSSFETVAVAEAWGTGHKRGVESQSQPRTIFRSPAKRVAAGD